MLAFTISVHTPLHFLKTGISWESGFLLFPELQKSLLVSLHCFCRTHWQWFENSRTHCFWDTPQHFLKTHFCLESGFLFSILELQKSLLVSFQGSRTQWQRFESASIHHFCDTLLHFLKPCFSWEIWLSFLPRAPEIPTSKFLWVWNTMAKVWKC